MSNPANNSAIALHSTAGNQFEPIVYGSQRLFWFHVFEKAVDLIKLIVQKPDCFLFLRGSSEIIEMFPC